MRVLFLSRRFFPAISGMSVYALNLVQELTRCGHDVTLVSQYRGDAAGAGVYGGGPPPDVPGVHVIGLESLGEQRVNAGEPADWETDVRAMVAAVEWCHGEQPLDVIHAQYAYPTGLAALEAGRRLGVPCVVSVQGGDGHWVGPCCATHAAAMKAVLNHAGSVLIGSKSFRDETCANNSVDPARFTIVPGATDTARFSPRPGLEENLGELRDPPRLLYHGRVDLRKGLGELIAAMPRILGAVPGATLTVSGIGPDVGAVRARAEELGLGGAVTLAGYASYDEAPDRLRGGDVFVSPTYSEGFSNTILEAMASGLPVVSTETVGVVDCLTDGENGLLVPVGAVDELADAVVRLLTDGDLRRRLAARALGDARRLYSWEAVGAQIQDVYADLRGAAPDPSWTAFYDPRRTVSDADLSCRFREAPHLL